MKKRITMLSFLIMFLCCIGLLGVPNMAYADETPFDLGGEDGYTPSPSGGEDNPTREGGDFSASVQSLIEQCAFALTQEGYTAGGTNIVDKMVGINMGDEADLDSILDSPNGQEFVLAILQHAMAQKCGDDCVEIDTEKKFLLFDL